MGSRHLAVIVVVLTLTAPSVVGVVCGLTCAAGAQHAMVTAGHHQAGMDMAGQRMTGHHICSHDVASVELYSRTAKRLPGAADEVLSVVFSRALMAVLAQRSPVAVWNPPRRQGCFPSDSFSYSPHLLLSSHPVWLAARERGRSCAR